jgi:hypothetical protein
VVTTHSLLVALVLVELSETLHVALVGSGSCGGPENPWNNNQITCCYKCVNNDEEEMDIDTPSLRASILEDE